MTISKDVNISGHVLYKEKISLLKREDEKMVMKNKC